MLFEVLFRKWNTTSVTVLENLSQILLQIKSHLSYDNEEEKITNAFVYSVYKVINKMITYFENHTNIDDIKTLQAIYKQVIDVAEVVPAAEGDFGEQQAGIAAAAVGHAGVVAVGIGGVHGRRDWGTG